MVVSAWLCTIKPQLSAAKAWLWSLVHGHKGIIVYALIHACYSKSQAMVTHARIHVYKYICYGSCLLSLLCARVLTCLHVSDHDLTMSSCAHVQIYMFLSLPFALVMCMHIYPNHKHAYCIHAYSPSHVQAYICAFMFMIPNACIHNYIYMTCFCLLSVVHVW